jgi:serine O-acetyltransferase
LSGKKLSILVERICNTYQDKFGVNSAEGDNLPRAQEIAELAKKFSEIIFPGFYTKGSYSMGAMAYHTGHLLTELYEILLDLTIRACRFECGQEDRSHCCVVERSEQVVISLLESIPELRQSTKLDIEAAYAGDPAASSFSEVILSYPGVHAITIQRFAHLLYHAEIPLLPRMLTEYVHGQTGIDIHPGAHLGQGMFIDHGTGVVIGETCHIGSNVKIYQGVTLGALSFPKDACGMIIKGKKRHPTLEDNVTIYAGASVLGDIVIGHDSIIGGNVWLTESLPPNTRIIISPPEQKIRTQGN